MKSRFKQNKNKLKFKFIKIISNFSKEDKQSFIKMIKDCDQILPLLRKIDSSLVKSHNIFKSYMSLMDI